MKSPDPKPLLVRAHLNRILASSMFRTSKRSQDFLRLVVERALAGHAEELKERAIGVEVFGRAPDYDTHEDAIVRVKANEIRKRLAQYYQAEGALDQVRIELPSGSYQPEFHGLAEVEGEPDPGMTPAPEAPLAAAPASTTPVAPRWLVAKPVWTVAGLLAIVLASVALSGLWRPTNAVQTFWGPMLEGQQPILIHLGQTISYQFSRRIHDEYLREHPEVLEDGPAYRIPLEPGRSFASEDIVVQQDMHISSGSAMVIANVGAILRQQDREFQVKFGGMSPGEGSAPLAVLVGAFNNWWTLTLTRDLRFRYERKLTAEGMLMSILDTQTGKRWDLRNVDTLGNTSMDYALITRLMGPQRRSMTVALGGLTHFGTEAASFIVTSPSGMARVAAMAPPGWEDRNMQILIQTGVVGRAAVKPEVLAVHVW